MCEVEGLLKVWNKAGLKESRKGDGFSLTIITLTVSPMHTAVVREGWEGESERTSKRTALLKTGS
jgi:hypothetical protein